MVNSINYQRELEKLILDNQKNNYVPNILLHGCCAPCSSYCLEYLSEYFNVTVYFYNPNISNDAEYNKRADELKWLIENMNYTNEVKYIDGDYEPDNFYEIAKGYEHCKEGSERCFRCYRLRLENTAKLATDIGGFDYFCTTLSISPLKNASKINEIGYELAHKYNINWLPSDFKKKNGYKRSVELSSEYNLYRQNYCGCVYSMRDL